MRVTEKGQVTIPKPIRDKLKIGPGSEVEFVERGDVVEVVAKHMDETPRQRRERLQRHLDEMRGTVDLGGMTTDEFMESLRGPRDDLDPR
ncbi:AbrB/MazE/SpoVT family DNA-binding domain-containing protein [Aureimonas pseudogalii]|jgi:AbrB family looped-hinge helix DNA binding protein|uniref:AbrB family looped-hinge helix DNA binding protein n=1 Tax=Aureimonas pseudogalii TaxID=1744844 RepID=A0A7W6H2D8_9HYPH|nr:AbrB/MazE/SpoVT family DNA-binding domain-containing protein [Aureimonas pseudogalii]MBB3996946.1 AbrB family looped-hinge helix DNA binding protein [Aureimonas pseudogalii]